MKALAALVLLAGVATAAKEPVPPEPPDTVPVSREALRAFVEQQVNEAYRRGFERGRAKCGNQT